MSNAAELFARQPAVVLKHLGQHAAHYAALTQLEAELAAGQWLRRALAASVALLAGTMALTLGGMALMLSATHEGDGAVPAALWAVPAVPMLLALIAGAWAARQPAPAFEMLREQVQQDLHLLARAAESA